MNTVTAIEAHVDLSQSAFTFVCAAIKQLLLCFSMQDMML